MHLDMHAAKRCGARTRSGEPCQSPAMTNGPMQDARGTVSRSAKGK